MASVSNRRVVCTNLPEELLNAAVAKQHFRRFGRMERIVLKRKSRSCTVDYLTPEAAQLAALNGGVYKGREFPVETGKKSPSRRSQKTVDSEWLPSKEVQSELSAMAATGPLKRRYNLRPEGMMVDVQSSFAQSPKKDKKRVQSWKDKGKPVTIGKIPKIPKYTTAWTSEQLELLNMLKQPVSTVEEKYRILEARDKLIRLRIKKGTDITNAKATVGICPDMCPEKERLMRETQHQVALYEQDVAGRGMNPSLAVKQYSRSSADQEVPLPHELRPVAVLQLTMAYLMHKIMDLCDSPDVNIAEWYHFLWDRTRGIRKDIIQQELCCQGSVALVEQCARFHIHSSARLVAEEPSVCDQKINTENLTKCLQTLKYMYHDLNLKGENCANEAEFRAYIILLNLNDGNFMAEVNQLRPEVQQSAHVRFALAVYSAIDNNNYIKFFKLVRTTTYLTACLLLRYFVQVRVRALQTILRCYTLRAPVFFPLTDLHHLLAFESLDTAIDFVAYYGLLLNHERTHVILDRTNFHVADAYPLERARHVVEAKREQCSVGEIVYGGTLPEATFVHHRPENSFTADGLFDLSPFLQRLIRDEKAARDVAVEIAEQRRRKHKEKEEGEISDDDDAAEEEEMQRDEEDAVERMEDSDVDETDASERFVPPAASESRPTTSGTVFGGAHAQNPFATPHFAKAHVATSPALSVEQQQATAVRLQQLDVERRLLQQKEELRRRELEVKAAQERLLAEQRRKEAALRREMEETARKKKEEAAEEERLRLQLREQRETLRRERAQRERAELERVRAEMKRMRDEEAARERRANEEIHLIVSDVIRHLLDRVERNYKADRLRAIKASLKQVKLKRLAGRWRARAQSLKRKRDALEQNPLWISAMSVDDEAAQLYTTHQACNLQDMKRYRGGRARDVVVAQPMVIEPMCIRSIYEVLTEKLSQTQTASEEIHWKIVVSLPDFHEMKTSLRTIDDVLTRYLQCNDAYNSCVIGRYRSGYFSTLHYCIAKRQGVRHFDDDAHGLLFVARNVNDLLLKRIDASVEKFGQFSRVPVVVILLDGIDTTSQDPTSERLQTVLESNKKISHFSIRHAHFLPRTLAAHLQASLQLLALHTRKSPPLQLDMLDTFVMAHLGTVFWRKVTSYARWNSTYKNCLKSPNVVIQLHNEGIDRVKVALLNRLYTEYPKCPDEFHDVETVPAVLPCDYRHFPTFWSSPGYSQLVEERVDALKLPKYAHEWPVEDRESLEAHIGEYCRTVSSDPRLFYHVMAAILKYERAEDVVWSDVVEVMARTRLADSDFALRHTEFHAKSIFHAMFVVYHPAIVRELFAASWFYIGNAHVSREMRRRGEGLWREEMAAMEETTVVDDGRDIDLDETWKQVMGDSVAGEREEEMVRTKNELDELGDLIADFDESVELQRKINERFQETIRMVLGS